MHCNEKKFLSNYVYVILVTAQINMMWLAMCLTSLFIISSTPLAVTKWVKKKISGDSLLIKRGGCFLTPSLWLQTTEYRPFDRACTPLKIEKEIISYNR